RRRPRAGGTSSRTRPRARGARSARSTSGSAWATRACRSTRRPRARWPRAGELTPVGYPALRQTIERFIAAGFSKFVVRPLVAPRSWRAELEALAAAVGDLQT